MAGVRNEAASAPGRQARDAALLVCMFHLNLAFSSLAPERRAHVVQACYWPMLRLAEETPFPIAFEATGWTLERIAEHDPAWIARARELIDDGRVELVGSGYAQCAAPLLPAAVNRWNLRLGWEAYERLLGTRPALALVCEQAYSPGLVPLYADAGVEAMIVDWDNAYRSNLDWDADVRRQPQRALGSGGVSLPVVWSESIAFQKFQRYAHDELSLERYVAFIAEAVGEGRGALMLYANDAEVFDHRPGRFAAEPKLAQGEWERVALALRTLGEAAIGTPALPRDVLARLDRPGAGRELRLEAPDQPIPVKKQDKYNITRWAVSGRDDVGINTRCQRVFERLRDGAIDDPAPWRRLCELWASDFRTHIGDARWDAMHVLLAQAEADAGVTRPAPGRAPAGPGKSAAALPAEVTREGRLWHVRTGHLAVTLNARRGLAIEAFADERLGADTLFGTLEHGYFPTIELGADWYTGDVVQEAPLRHKVTDLEPMQPRFERTAGGVIRAFGRLATELGEVEKVVEIDGAAGTVTIDTTLHWPELPPGSLRAAHLVLDPAAFDAGSLFYATHNGGDELERHELAGCAAFDHAAPVSALVSCRQGLGVTEGVLLLGDRARVVRVEVDMAVCKPLGIVGYTPIGERPFFRAALSITEGDDTRRGSIPRSAEDPQRIRVTLSAAPCTSA
jgi:hypothetical protein